MKFVAINTAGPIIELAYEYEDRTAFASMDKVQAAEQLLPALDKLLDGANLKLSDFDDFVCVTGPGSFTGIRIGINTVRAFAYALNKKAYGVTYSRVMAYNNGGAIVAIDGGATACYVASYDGETETLVPTCIYKKSLEAFASERGKPIVSDFGVGRKYTPDGSSLLKAARYAINHTLGTEPLYIRKPQPDRKENEI